MNSYELVLQSLSELFEASKMVNGKRNLSDFIFKITSIVC